MVDGFSIAHAVWKIAYEGRYFGKKTCDHNATPFECGSFFDPLKQFSKVAFYLVLLSISSKLFCLYGQNPGDMPLRQVIEETQKLIGEGNFAGASPYLDELQIRFEDDKNPEVEKILQQ